MCVYYVAMGVLFVVEVIEVAKGLKDEADI
jgi:hypothetical protein